MMNRGKNLKDFVVDRFFFLICLIALSLVSSVTLFFDRGKPSYYEYLWMLPFMHALIVTLIVCRYPSAIKNFCFVSIVAMYSIRNALTPFCMFLGNYYGLFKMLDSYKVNKAIFLMLYETFFILIYSAYRSRRGLKKKQKNISIGNCQRADVLFVISIAFGVFVYVFRPVYFSGFRAVFQTNELRIAETDESALGPLFTLFYTFFPVAYLYCGLYLLNLVNKMKKSVLRNVLNYAIIGIPLLFMNNSDGFTLICVVALALTALSIGGISLKQFIVLGTIFIFGIMILLFVLISNGDYDNIYHTLSVYMQAYFPGIGNFAGYYNMKYHNKLSSFFYDVYFVIPFRNSVIGIPGDQRLVMLYTADNKAWSNIVPCFIQLYHYFWIFAPFVEMLYIKFAFRNYERAIADDNVYSYFSHVITWIYLLITPIMYNFTIFMTWFLHTIVYFFCISKYLKRKITPNTIRRS